MTESQLIQSCISYFSIWRVKILHYSVLSSKIFNKLEQVSNILIVRCVSLTKTHFNETLCCYIYFFNCLLNLA